MHVPVLLEEVIKYLDPKPGDKIVDATLDGGGHAIALVEKVAPEGKVLGIELDSKLLKEFEAKIKNLKLKNNLILVNDSYVNIKEICNKNNFRPNGILFDLGLSSWHLEKSGRGFSFKKDEPLDMRFNTEKQRNNTEESRKTAVDIVNTYSEQELERIIREYGEERFSKQIAKNIVFARRREPILTTSSLVGVISQSVPNWYKKRKIHFATKTFQALRIETNSELENIKKGISAAFEALNLGGRLAVISFHGVEDKLVKEIFKNKVAEGMAKFVIKGTIKSSWIEVKSNPRSRSAKLKIIEKIN
jgi:16S rRNA (cytosine1402-N4)-methyltransferase